MNILLGASLLPLYYKYSSESLFSFTSFFAHLIALFGVGSGIALWISKPNSPSPELPDPAKWSSPNRIPLQRRLLHTIGAVFLFLYGSYGLYSDNIPIPTKYGTLHFSGLAAWLLFGAMLCAVVNLVTVVVDHFDRRNNELAYAHVAAATQWIGWTFFVAALFQDLFQSVR